MINICFTGHRPAKLYGYDWKQKGNQKILLTLRDVLVNYIDNSNELDFCFRFGGALGVDQMAFEVVYRLKETVYKGSKVGLYMELCIPFDGYHKPWSSTKDITRFNSQVFKSDKVIYVDKIQDYSFLEGKLLPKVIATIKNDKRNHYMVDNSDVIISIFKQEDIINKINSGTKNCIIYANKLYKKRINIHPIHFNISYLTPKEKQNNTVQLSLL